MNVNAINRTIDAIRNDTSNKFNMHWPETCVIGFAVRASEVPAEDEYYHTGKLAEIFDITFRQASEIAFPNVNNWSKLTRNDAAKVLEHFRDIGKVNWKITKPLTGWAYRMYDKLVAA